MLRLLIRRLLALVPLLFLITVGTFLLARMIEGNPAQAIAGDGATQQEIDAAAEKLHLNDPLPVRYVRWLGDVATGDLGTSVATGRPVSTELARKFPVTASLAISALVLIFVIGIPLGVLQGMRPGSRTDRFLLGGVSLGLATPNFLIATLGVYLLAVRWKWLPAIGYVSIFDNPWEFFRHMILPALSLAIVGGCELSRQLRSGLIGVSNQDYVRSARARGLSPLRVVGKHSLKNAFMPALTILGVRVGSLLAGSVIIEQIFQLNGLGSYTLQAIQNKDFTVVQGVVLAMAVIVVVTNLLVDLAYSWLNPKVRVS